ncbi:MAG: DNA-binding protein [Candidatus Bathyarchaeota archaeon]|jgi:predicted DNA-binding protein with PD1-like motif|nr:DNA-binding protein [Candidatus Bathyarchaeota archaeon]
MLKGQVGQVYVARILEGEDLPDAILRRVREGNVKAGFFVVIGSLKRATLGYYKDGKYENVELEGPLEIASGMGNIAVNEEGEPMIHAHIVVSDRKGEAFGGHLMKESPVGATAELVIVESLGLNLVRAQDEKTGLNLLRLD